ncbi:MAG: winged helix-turn-helix domain-containing protein [Candidatus Daviesbacteria bacterium]|nr:winged helix-turn-helix domain-containing protein [Candidatus Daviesbacteria bacterium]
MKNYISFSFPLTINNFKAHYLQAKDPREARQWHTLWLVAKGKRVEEVADITGYTEYWVRAIVRQYNKKGETSIGDKRHNNPGAKPFLSDSQKRQLVEALKTSPPDGGLWNGVKVAAWIAKTTGKSFIYPQRGWKYLVDLGFSLKVPRPTHKKTSKKAADDFKKNLKRL